MSLPGVRGVYRLEDREGMWKGLRGRGGGGLITRLPSEGVVSRPGVFGTRLELCGVQTLLSSAPGVLGMSSSAAYDTATARSLGSAFDR